MVRNTYEVQNIGDLLREKRKQLGMDIKDIAAATKIRSEYLLALESGNYDKFAANVYAKGFLKKYAKYLGINPERASAMYRREQTSKNPAELGPAGYFASKLKTGAIELNPGKLMAGFIALLVIGFGLYIVAQILAVARPPRLEIIAPVAAAAGETKILEASSAAFTITGNAEVGTTVKVNGQQVNTNNFERFTVNDLQLATGENYFAITATNQFGQESKVNLTVLYNSVVNADVQAETPVTSGNPQMNIVLAVDGREAYIQTRVDGAAAAKIYNVGETQQLTARETFTLSTPRPDAINLTINEVDYQILNTREYSFKLVNGQVVVTQ